MMIIIMIMMMMMIIMIIIKLIMIIIMMMMMIISLKGVIRDFYNLFTAPRTSTLKWPGRNRVQITCYTESAYHVQHVSHMLRRDSSALRFDRIEIACILVLVYCLKPLRWTELKSHVYWF